MAFELFCLVPRDKVAREIVKLNPKFQDNYKDEPCLSFRTNSKYHIPGRLAFGSLRLGNDVILTEDCARTQCFFSLTEGGDLMLEDLTTGHHTYISWYERADKKLDKFSMQGDPRRRVIPRARAHRIKITFGKDVSFDFVWMINLKYADQIGLQLSQIYWAQYRPDLGMTLHIPKDPKLERDAFEKRSPNTPRVPKKFDGNPTRQIYIYKHLGSGAFGSVSKAVDLATGRLWAVKECLPSTSKDKGETWKVDFKREVEKLATLQHRHIVRLEHHQGWVPGKPVQIFLALYHGSLEDILPRHSCYSSVKEYPRWLNSFIKHTFTGLDFLHDKRVIHRDIKPGNILFNRDASGNFSFYLSDFGLAASARSVDSCSGTLFYMAPEITRRGSTYPASDIYSLGITFLEVLARICPNEAGWSERKWRDKLKAYNVRGYTDYRDVIPRERVVVPEVQLLHSRVQSLIDNYLVRPSVARLLHKEPSRRPSALSAMNNLLVEYNGAENGQVEMPMRPKPIVKSRPPSPERRRREGF